ncbi:MAG: PPOX class F420-dependent oxidoreductase [Nocardioides sp.]
MALTDEKYMAFTTHRRSGEPVTTPVWLVPVSDGRIGFWTAMGSGKTKRLKNDPRVEVQPSDVRGRVKPGTTPVPGTAEMVQSGPLFDEVHAAVKNKYGVMTSITKVMGRLMGQRRSGQSYADTVVLVRLDG